MMVIQARLVERMAAAGISQAALARAVGVSQQAIGKLVKGGSRSTFALHRIARVLNTTPAYLEGEIDDPDEGASAPVPMPRHQIVSMSVVLPSEAALARMFQGLLGSLGDWSGLGEAELAHELATLLPIGLGQLRGPLREEALEIDEAHSERIEDRTTADPVRRRA